MIQIDINSPETGQTAPQGLRNDRADQNGEDLIEFAQIWSETIEQNTQKVALPREVHPPILNQSDAAPSEGSPETEQTTVQPKPHPVEIGLIESEGTRSTHPTQDGPQKPQSSTQSDARADQLSTAKQDPIRNPKLRTDLPDVVQAPHAREQLASPTERAETSIAMLPIEKSGSGSTLLPSSEHAAINTAILLQSETSPMTPVLAPSTAPIASGAASTNGQAQQQLFSNRASRQAVEHDQSSRVRLPNEGPKNQASLPASLQEPFQVTAQRQNSSPYVTLPVQEPSRAPQPIATSNSPALSKSSLMAVPKLSKSEPFIPMPNGASEIELQPLQSIQNIAAKASTTVSPTSQLNAPQVASQIVAAISQSSGTTTEIILNPEELGRVRISLTNGDAGMTVNILTERSETSDLMRRNIEILARELRDMGYENPSFSFDDRSSGSSDAWDDEHSESDPENPNSVSELPTSSMHVTLTGGLDLKL